MDLSYEQVQDTLLKKVKVYNYILKAAKEAYCKATLGVYHKDRY